MNDTASPIMDYNGILIVDDEPVNLRLLTDMLDASGYKVYVAPNGQLALQWLTGHLPALILLDIRMPGLDGYVVLEALQA